MCRNLDCGSLSVGQNLLQFAHRLLHQGLCITPVAFNLFVTLEVDASRRVRQNSTQNLFQFLATLLDAPEQERHLLVQGGHIPHLACPTQLADIDQARKNGREDPLADLWCPFADLRCPLAAFWWPLAAFRWPLAAFWCTCAKFRVRQRLCDGLLRTFQSVLEGAQGRHNIIEKVTYLLRDRSSTHGTVTMITVSIQRERARQPQERRSQPGGQPL